MYSFQSSRSIIWSI